MRIGMLGGSFNPPHKRHLKLGLELISKNILDKIIYIPNINNPYHDKKLVSYEDRYNMVSLMIKNYPNLEISDIEIKKDKQSYTYQTMDEMRNIYPNDDLYLIIGSDNLKEIEHWGQYLYLLENYKIVVIKRDDDNIEDIINSKDFLINNRINLIVFNDIEVSYISSTIIRDKLSKKEDVSMDIDDSVYNYIIENNLY